MGFLRKKSRRQPAAPAYTSTGWVIEHSPTMPTTPRDEGAGAFSLVIPRYDGPNVAPGTPAMEGPPSVHYVTKPTGSLRGLHRVTIKGEIVLTPGAILQATQGDAPAQLRLYFQRAGDNLSAQGEYADYRWWSAPLRLAHGPFEHSAELTHENWSSVYPRDADQAGFENALPYASRIGFTFGGVFAGHGVRVIGGTAVFKWTEFGP